MVSVILLIILKTWDDQNAGEHIISWAIDFAVFTGQNWSAQKFSSCIMIQINSHLNAS